MSRLCVPPFRAALLVVGLGLTSEVHAAAPTVHPGYGVSPERIREFEKLRNEKQVPLQSRPEVMPLDLDRRRHLEADLVRYEDGWVVVAKLLDRDSRNRLRRMGVPVVTRFEDLRDGVLFDDRFYRVLPVSPTKKACLACPDGHLTGPDSVLLTRRVGLRVRLELASNAAGRSVVVGITTLEE